MKKRVYKYKDFKKKKDLKSSTHPDSFIRDDNSNECFIKLIFKAFELGKKGGTLNQIVIKNPTKGFYAVELDIDKDILSDRSS